MPLTPWVEVPWTRVPPKPKADPKPNTDLRLTGADRAIAKNAPVVNWLAKCYAELLAEGPAAWPCFSTKGLGEFLHATRTPVPAAGEKAAGRLTAMYLPAALEAPEGCVKCLTGASFLSQDTGTVCQHLHRRRALARL
jgi:hypothetical protein